jgi:hypothetical protein
MNMTISNATLSIGKVVKDFAYIQTTRANVCTIFLELKQKLEDLNKIYVDVVNTHGMKEYTFGLDAFHFQSKLIDYESENMQKLLNIVTNRFYCEYYKLYKIVLDYVNNEVNLNLKLAHIDVNVKHVDVKHVDIELNTINNKVFPVYKDLDKNINYDFALTVEIQAIIVKYINALNDYLLTKHNTLNTDNIRQSKCGINIEHIVHYQSFTNALIAERIMLYIRYMEALNKHHTTYITRLYTISKDLIDNVNREIMTNEMGTNEMGTNEMGTNEMGTNEMSTNEMSTNEMGTNEMGTNEMGANEMGTNEMGTNEMGAIV